MAPQQQLQHHPEHWEQQKGARKHQGLQAPISQARPDGGRRQARAVEKEEQRHGRRHAVINHAGRCTVCGKICGQRDSGDKQQQKSIHGKARDLALERSHGQNSLDTGARGAILARTAYIHNTDSKDNSHHIL
jgi:hypothetical protein